MGLMQDPWAYILNLSEGSMGIHQVFVLILISGELCRMMRKALTNPEAPKDELR